MRYSEDFSNALWTKAAVTLTSSTGINPKGTNQTLYTITRQTAAGDGLHAPLASAATGNGVGMSLWIRRVSGPGSTGQVWLGREPSSGSNPGEGSNYTIGSEWQRIEYKSTGYTGTSRMYINPIYPDSFQIWGAQTEKSGGGTTRKSIQLHSNYCNGGYKK